MTEIIIAAVLVFICGAFFGVVAIAGLRARRETPEEFDGGYLHDNRPRAITRITSKDIDWEISQ